MRFLYAKLTGYIGIYNGLGLNELEIDFTKCKNKICVVRGSNGCGKSSLLNALSVLPDGNENFVPGFPASKQLRILDGEMVYDIFINHPLDGKGNRAVTKVSIQKNGVELNPNGNVSSYKDIIYDEFDLDSCFITLTHLSGDDRGLADKKPAERKKFLASITNSLETYNGMYKNFNKKSNAYKSFLTRLSGKVTNIGDENNLRSTKTNLKNRYDSINKEIEDIKTIIIQNQTIASMNDPNGELQQKYISLETQLESAKRDYYTAKSFFDKNCSSNGLDKDINKLVQKKEEQENLLQDHIHSLESDNSRLSIIVNDIKNLNENIEKDKVRIEKLSRDIDPNLEIALNNNKQRLDELLSNFSSVGLESPEEITKDNIDQIIKIIDQFIQTIDVIYENLSDNELVAFAEYIQNGIILQSIIDEKLQLIHEAEMSKSSFEEKLRKYEHDSEIISELDKRPKKCKIDSCPYISNAMTLIGSYGSRILLHDRIRDCESKIRECNKLITQFKEELDFIKNIFPMRTNLDRIRDAISLNYEIFNKIGIIRPITNFEAVTERISRRDLFNEFRDIKSLNYLSNDIIEYKSVNSIYQKLFTDYTINKNNIESLKEYEKEVEEYTTKLTESYTERDLINKDIIFLNSIIDKTKTCITSIDNCIQDYNTMLEKEVTMTQIEAEYTKLQKQFEGSAEVIKKIHELELSKNALEQQLQPIDEQIKSIDTELTLLDRYKQEYEEYSSKYNYINVLKKYSSPTSGGIQTFFMNLYMGKTLELANQLLGMIFQGQYQLLDYVITADEFRMPFLGSGLIVDDITSGSTSQVCIMGMIISLSLLNQASTTYNITRLDEIDGGLDSANRMVFMQILQKVIDILGIEQLFIISHNMESYNGGTDAIVLAPIEGVDDNSNGSNIIYHY